MSESLLSPLLEVHSLSQPFLTSINLVQRCKRNHQEAAAADRLCPHERMWSVLKVCPKKASTSLFLLCLLFLSITLPELRGKKYRTKLKDIFFDTFKNKFYIFDETYTVLHFECPKSKLCLTCHPAGVKFKSLAPSRGIEP